MQINVLPTMLFQISFFFILYPVGIVHAFAVISLLLSVIMLSLSNGSVQRYVGSVAS